MKTLFIYELKKNIINIKTLLIVISFNLIAFYISKYSQNILVISGGKESLVSIIYAFIETIGILFGFLIFSGTVSKLVENESIRYIIPYVSRVQLILTKYLVILTYFIFLLLSVIPVIFLTQKALFFPIGEIAQGILFFNYITTLILLISVLSSKERNSTFLGIFLGIFVPILGGLSLVSKNYVLMLISWLLPYRYSSINLDSFVLLIISFFILALSIVLFQKKEL